VAEDVVWSDVMAMMVSSRSTFLIICAHDWQKIRFVFIFGRFSAFLMECVV
jgi:hypothetical protein